MSVKEIEVKLISKPIADIICKKYHYSKKVCSNSKLNFGVFFKNKIEGVVQFGVSMDKNRMAKNLNLPLNDFLEINRMALSNDLPKNSESRVLGICIREIKKQYKNIRAILSFADATQCGDGFIYRASNFKLINIKKNTSILNLSDEALQFGRKHIPTLKKIVSRKSLDDYVIDGKYLSHYVKKIGATQLIGYQLKYIYCYDSKDYENFEIIPFSKIKEIGASMYKGKRVEHENNATSFQDVESGVVPTNALQQLQNE
jgi:hypothetical protein